MPSASASTRGRPRASTPTAMRTPSTTIATWSEVLNDTVPVDDDLSSTPTSTVTTTTTTAVRAQARRRRRGTAETAAGARVGEVDGESVTTPIVPAPGGRRHGAGPGRRHTTATP